VKNSIKIQKSVQPLALIGIDIFVNCNWVVTRWQ
jgi:hypothetical protein